MRILITGICGFVGSTIARTFIEGGYTGKLYGLDNFIRPGSEINRIPLSKLGIPVYHADIRSAADFETLPDVDWILDAAANPSVLAGVDGRTSARQLVEHNLLGTINMLEYCRARKAGFILLSTSRVYSINELSSLQVEVCNGAYHPVINNSVQGISDYGVNEAFPTAAPVSLYGATKIASEQLALEYGDTFGFPVWINRCGVMAGAGQFGRPDQGIYAYWIHSWARRRPLTYIGFDGQGHQVRDCLHPRDLVSLLKKQMLANECAGHRIAHFSGGVRSACSLKQCSDWCAERFGAHAVASEPMNRQYDIPWLVLDSRRAEKQWNWEPQTRREDVFEEIARHAERDPDWLERSRLF
jgi:CDP-paratose 2-epimerase